MGVVDLFLEHVGLVRLHCDVPLGRKNLSLTAVNLLSSGSDLPLEVVVVTVLLVQQESGVVYFLTELMDGSGVGIMSLLEVIVLEEFLILEVSVLALDGVELVSQS